MVRHESVASWALPGIADSWDIPAGCSALNSHCCSSCSPAVDAADCRVTCCIQARQSDSHVGPAPAAAWEFRRACSDKDLCKRLFAALYRKGIYSVAPVSAHDDSEDRASARLGSISRVATLFDD